MAPSIPDRWLNYMPVGKRVEGTRFIAFKVPLREAVNENVENAKRLDANILLKTVPKLGMIIDLTNTSKYYNPNSFVNQGLEYNKLMIPGHKTPQPHLVKKFKEMVLNYLKKNPDNDKLIGVHCTHGVNRTGYLICNFMISELNMRSEEAIDKFNTSRGHQIERKNYLDSLHDLNKLKKSGDNPKSKYIDNLNANNSNCISLREPRVKEPISWRAPAEPDLPPSPQMFDKRDRFERARQETNAQRQRITRPPQTFGKNTFNPSDGNNRNYSSRYVNASRSQVASSFPHNSSNHNNYHTMRSNNKKFVAHAYDNPRSSPYQNPRFNEPRTAAYQKSRFDEPRTAAYQKPRFDEPRTAAYQKPRFDEPITVAYQKPRFDESRTAAYQKPRFDKPRTAAYQKPRFDESRSSAYQTPRCDRSRPYTSAHRNRPLQRE